MVRALYLTVLLLGASAGAAAARPKSDQGRKYLDAAIRLYGAFEFERALAQLEKARKMSEGAAMDVTIALYEGMLQLELGHDEQAEAAFKTGLSLDPNAVLPTRVSPKVTDLFNRLKGEMASNPSPEALQPAPAPAAPPPPEPAVVAVPAITSSPRAKSPPLLWWAPAAGGAALAVVGSVLVVQAKDRSDKLSGRVSADFDLATAERYRSEGKTFQTLGFAGIGLGVACVLASALLLLLVRS